jgi:hypothetical protein
MQKRPEAGEKFFYSLMFDDIAGFHGLWLVRFLSGRDFWRAPMFCRPGFTEGQAR